MQFTRSMQENLLTATKWLKFLTILACVGVVFMVLGVIGCVIFGIVGAFANQAGQGAISFAMMMGCAVMYLVCAIAYIYPILKSFKYIKYTRLAIANDSDQDMEESLSNYKSLWKYIGIMTIVGIALYVLFIIGAVVVGVIAGVSTAAGNY